MKGFWWSIKSHKSDKVSEIKTCPKCKENLPVERFWRNKSRKDGFDRLCKLCGYVAQKASFKRKDPRKKILNRARERAKSHGFEFNLTLDDISIPNICPVLGIEIILGLETFSDNSPSLDRIDNTKGYIKGNIAIISYKANNIKNSGSIEEHLKIVEYMKRHLITN